MDRLKTIGIVTLVVAFLPILLVYLALHLLWLASWGAVLRVWFWRAHAIHGRPIFFVYSESPNWQHYIEANILPRIAERSVVLNWSERRLWSSHSRWESWFFYRFAGHRDYNPLALVFSRGGRIKDVRFHKAFLDFKHGEASELRRAEAELYALDHAAV